MTWYFDNNEINELPEQCVGFVYKITCLKNNKKYIGKKLAKFTKTSVKTVLQKNGIKKKKKIKTLVDSDWRTYYGSSEALLKDLELFGADNFKREILYICTSKSACSYLELREQIINNVLFYPDEWYNSYVGARVHRNHVKDLDLQLLK